VDAKSELPVAMTVTPANENEKRDSLELFEEASRQVKLWSRACVADPQYGSQSLREATLRQGSVPVIPYPRNQQKGIKGVLRIDRRFRSHGSEHLRRTYKKRVGVKRVSRGLKNLAGLTQHNL